jgi:F0F1-type ATP synthase assembly protein I
MGDEPSRSVPPDGEDRPAGEAAAWTVLSYLITGPLVYGGLGWLADRWLHTSWLAVVGMTGGMVLAVYVVYLRYGRPPGASGPGESQQ